MNDSYASAGRAASGGKSVGGIGGRNRFLRRAVGGRCGDVARRCVGSSLWHVAVGRGCAVSCGCVGSGSGGPAFALNAFGLLFGLFLAAFGHFVHQQAVFYMQQLGALLDVYVAHDGFGYYRNALYQVADQFSPFDGVASGILQQQISFEANKVRFVFVDECLKLGSVVLAGERVGVVAVGQEAHFDVHALFEQHVDASYGGFDTGCIAVVEHGHVVGEAVYHLDLLCGQRCTRRGYHILHTALVHGDDVGITFHQEAAVLLHDGLLGEVDAIEFVALVIDFAFGRVDVLHFDALGGSGQYTSAEGYHFARQRMDGEDDASPETVAQAVVVRLVAEAGLHQKLFLISFLEGFLGKGIVAVGTVAQLELLDDVVAETRLWK